MLPDSFLVEKELLGLLCMCVVTFLIYFPPGFWVEILNQIIVSFCTYVTCGFASSVASLHETSRKFGHMFLINLMRCRRHVLAINQIIQENSNVIISQTACLRPTKSLRNYFAKHGQILFIKTRMYD